MESFSCLYFRLIWPCTASLEADPPPPCSCCTVLGTSPWSWPERTIHKSQCWMYVRPRCQNCCCLSLHYIDTSFIQLCKFAKPLFGKYKNNGKKPIMTPEKRTLTIINKIINLSILGNWLSTKCGKTQTICKVISLGCNCSLLFLCLLCCAALEYAGSSASWTDGLWAFPQVPTKCLKSNLEIPRCHIPEARTKVCQLFEPCVIHSHIHSFFQVIII